ncbi:recombinase family protein [Streptomyces sp. NPDC019396]|uniref:recombinase family protein n=1 Tax=Streptomyces sp. NPDC019396 TaxID=3154687 RepID=UPI0033E2FDD3
MQIIRGVGHSKCFQPVIESQNSIRGRRSSCGPRATVLPVRDEALHKRCPLPRPPLDSGLLTGYARCSTDMQDLTAQQEILLSLGVPEERIYLDRGLTGSNRHRPGLRPVLGVLTTSVVNSAGS